MDKVKSAVLLGWLALGAAEAVAQDAWWDPAWTKRRKLTFDNSGQASNLTNFPVLVKLTASRITYGDAQGLGQDIRFVDAGTAAGGAILNHEIEYWRNGSDESFFWVKVPQIDASSTTDYIWIYYGNGAAVDAQNRNGVWDTADDYNVVYHLNIVGDSLRFEPTFARDPVMALVPGSEYVLIAHTSASEAGIARTVTIDSGGAISDAVVSTYTFETSTNKGLEPAVIRVGTSGGSEIYAIVYRDNNTAGRIKTIAVNPSTGAISAAPGSPNSATYETSGNKANTPDVIGVGGEYYAIAYLGGNGGDNGTIKTVRISSNGSILNAGVATATFAGGSDKGYEPDIIAVAGEYYAIAFRGIGGGDEGGLRTVQITAAGVITNASVSSATFAGGADKGLEPSIVAVSGEYYAIAFRGIGGGDGGGLRTVQIDAGGTILNAGVSSATYTAALDKGLEPHIVKVSSEYYAIAYRGITGGGDRGGLQTVRIDTGGSIVSTNIDTYTFDSTKGNQPFLINTSGDIYAVAYWGAAGDEGWIKSGSISSTGDIQISGDADDSTANNYDGIGSAPLGSAGQMHRAGNFDGTDDALDAGGAANLHIAGPLTVEAWIKYDTLDAGTRVNYLAGRVGNAETPAENDQYGFSIDGDKTLRLFWESGSGTDTDITSSTTATLTAGAWHHLAVTRQAAPPRVNFYVDGVLLGTQQSYTGGASAGSDTEFSVGAHQATRTFNFDGVIDEVRVSDTDRSADWIKAQYLSMTDAFITAASWTAPIQIPRFWVSSASSANGNWNNTGNWSTASGGSPGASVPARTASIDHVAIFNGAVNAQFSQASTRGCTIDAAVNVQGLEMKAGYTGTITQGANTVTLSTDGLRQAAGTFTGGSVVVDDNGPFILTGGTFTAPTATFSVSGTWSTTAGTFSHNNSTVDWDATGSQSVSLGAHSFNHLTVSGAGTTTLTAGTLDVNGTLTVSAGTLALGARNATLGDDVTVAGTYSQAAGGTTTFDRTSNQTVSGAGSLTFGTASVANGAAAVVTFNASASVLTRLWVNAGAGTFSLSGGRTLTMSNAAQIDVDGGTFAAAGSSGSLAAITTPTPGTDRFSMDVASGAAIDLNWFSFTSPDATGLAVHSGGVIGRLDNGTFNTVAAGGSYINLNPSSGVPIMSDRTNLAVSFHNLVFNGSGGYSIKAGPNTPPVLVTTTNTAAALWGESFDDDDGEGGLSTGRIMFDAAPVARMSGTTVAETFASFELALADADVVDGTRLRALTRWPLNLRALSLDAVGDNVVIENAVLWPRSGPAVDNASLRGTLRNCLIVKGGADFTTLQNCTVYDPTGSTPATTNGAATNTIFEEAAPGLPSGDTTNLKSASSALFAAASEYDFHLLSSAASAIDTGTALTLAEDFDGHIRPLDGDNNGSSLWDIGADERAYDPGGVIGTTPDVQAAVNLGDISQVWSVFRGATRYVYAVTRGGSRSGNRDNMLVLLRRSDLAEMARYTAPGPVHGMIYAAIDSSGADTEYRIFILVDTNRDGYADGIQALIDTIDTAALPADVDFTYAADWVNPVVAQTDANAASWYSAGKIVVDRSFDKDGNVNDGGITDAYVNTLPAGGGGRIAHVVYRSITPEGDGAAPTNGHDLLRWSKRVFAVSTSTLYKVNADPLDITDDNPGNRQHGRAIWNSTDRAFEWRAPLVFQSTIDQELWAPVSSDGATRQVTVKMDWDGNTNPGVAAGWTVDGTAANDENRWGHVMKLGGTANNGSTFIFAGATDGRKAAGWRANNSSTGSFWTSGDLGDAGDTVTSPPVRPLPAGTKYLFIGVGDEIEKLTDDSTLGDGNPANGVNAWGPGTDGDSTAGYGEIASNLDYITFSGVTRLFWGTRRGFAGSFKIDLNATPGSGAELFDAGFPYAVAADEVNNVLISYEGPATGWSIQFATKSGRFLKYYMQ